LKRAIVIGANGQDGHFLVKHLLRRGYKVVGLGRQAESRWDHGTEVYEYRHVDLRVDGALMFALEQVQPEIIFHVAAVHTSAGGKYEEIFSEVLKVNTGSVHSVLEYLRKKGNGQLLYASSGKVFGKEPPERIDEDTQTKNDCLYSLSKNTSSNIVNYYRKHHEVTASIVYPFNHESEFRPRDFFIPIVIDSLATALREPGFTREVKTLDFYCDWGSAEEFMAIMIDIGEKAPGQDFVLGTGSCTYGRNLVESLFHEHGLDYRDVLITTGRDPSIAPRPYHVDTMRLNNHVHRVPERNILFLCREILMTKYQIG
jgi:GDPmannose 4,6-dehydratase